MGIRHMGGFNSILAWASGKKINKNEKVKGNSRKQPQRSFKMTREVIK